MYDENNNGNNFDPMTGQPVNNDSAPSQGIDLSKPDENNADNGFSRTYNSTPMPQNDFQQPQNGYQPYGSNQGYNPQQGNVPNYSQPMNDPQGYNPQQGNVPNYGQPMNDPQGYNPQQGNVPNYGQPQGYNGGYARQELNQQGNAPSYVNNMQNNNPQQYAGYNTGLYAGYNPYQDPYAGYGQRPSQGLAIGSLVCGLASILFCIVSFAFPPLFLLPIVGIILGIVHKCKHLPVGKGMSTAGIILSAIGCVLPIIIIAVMIMNMPALLDMIEEMDPATYEQLYEEYAEQLPGWFSSAFAMVKSLFIK